MKNLLGSVYRWAWVTFVYDRMWHPTNWARAAWVKTRGYPLPTVLQPPLTVRGRRDPEDWQLASSFWTPVGVLIEAWKIHRAGGYVRVGWRR